MGVHQSSPYRSCIKGCGKNFTQSIHTFIEDKKTLESAYSGKRRKHSYWDLEYKALREPNGKSLGYIFRMISSRMTFETTTNQTPSQPPKPKPAPAKPQEKKRKRALDAAEAPSQAKRSKAGRVSKKRTLQLRDEFIDEGVHATEPRVGDEEAIVQKVLEERQMAKEKWDKSHIGSVLPEINAQGQEEGQGRTNPGDAGMSQTPSSHVVYAGPNLDHMDLGIAEASSQPNIEQMDDEFTSTAYPKVQENLKLLTEGDVRLEEPASSARTLSSMKNLDKEFSFTDQFLIEKSQEDEQKKTNTEAEVPVPNDDGSHSSGILSSVPLMTTPVIDIIDPQSDSTTVPASMPTTTTTTIGQLEQNIADLVDANQALEERLDKQGNRIHQLETQDLSRLIRE
ncbi:hypothetical protein Tco_0702704 [Tanacetum coccineum]|uniref:Uncharacterized protein n=1 Tax=Tanacetum coccineum TaxID=301880 RepID=A0ABQ4XYD4_9ASTR